MMEIDFDRRVAIVTGAGNGLGRSYAKALAARGASLIVNDLGGGIDGTGTSRAAADAVVDEIRAAGGTAAASYDSVASPQGGRAIVQKALDTYGRVDIVINNAGILRNGPFTEQTPQDIDRTIATHLLGAFYVTQPAFGFMRQGGYGRIVFTSSLVGAFGSPWGAAYGAAKGGVIGLMNVVALEGERHGILCNTILPGALTRMAPGDIGAVPDELREIVEATAALNSGMTPDYVTPMVLYLASERCRATHSIYSAVGGRYARVFIGLTRGWAGPTDAPPRVEDIEMHLDAIEEQEGYMVPKNGADELKAIAAARFQ